LGVSRNFAEDFSSMQEMPMECGLLARVALRRDAKEKRFATRESAARASESCRHGPERVAKNFFV
jgi:hypothetical protein